ncbi:MAG: carboxypeptidase regulatory-like domain-containing protein, partial [bacterium]
MRSARVAILVVFLYVSLSLAQPTYYGTRGLLRTISADNQGKSFLTLTFHANYYQENFSRTVEHPYDYTLRNAKGFLAGAFAANDYIELSGGFGSVLASDKSVYGDTAYTKFGFGDAFAGVKLSFAPVWFLKLGGYGFYNFPTGSSVLKDKKYTLQKENFGGIGCVTFDFINPKAKIPFPVRIHLNGGYLIDKNDSSGIEKNLNDLLILRGGFEIPAGAFELFADFSTEQAINNKDLKFSKNPMRITPGLRFYSYSSMLEFGCEIGLGDTPGVESIPGKRDKMSWKAFLGVSFISRIVKPQAYADVTGTVLDSDTRSPIAATITALNEEKVTPVSSDASGKYKIRLSTGPHTLSFKADGYKELIKSVEIKDTLGLALDITLEPLVSYGFITGKLYDAKTAQPLSGQIRFPGTEIEPINVDPSTGVYKAKLPTGTYTMELEIPGYYKVAEPIVITKGETSQKNIALKPIEKDEGTITGKVFNQKTGKPIGGIIQFPDKPEIQPVEINPATGIYEAKLPTGSYTVAIEIPGYEKKVDVIVVKKGEIVKTDFPLVPVEKIVGGMITGTVKDANTGSPLEAIISVAEGNIPSQKTNPSTGAFNISIPAGTYTLKVSRDGYVPTTQTVVVKEKETTVQNFTLKPVPMGTLTGKVVNV